jgi:predicted transcriptional regulator
LWECDANGFSQIGIKIAVSNSSFKVKKCGLRMVYKKDIEDLNRTTAQCSNNNITPYEGLDVLHHNFNNSAVQRKLTKSSKAVMTMMGLDLVEKEALMMYHTQKGLKGSQNLCPMDNSDCEESSDST